MQTLNEGYNVCSIASGDEVNPEAQRETKEKLILRMLVTDNIILHIRDCNKSNGTCNTLKYLYHRD
jgi:hypothetical protein